MYYSKLHGFVARNPALPVREDYYNPPARFGYPRLRGEPIVPLIRGGYDGLGGYISSDVGKKWEWDSFAVGVGAAAVTFMLGLLPSIISQATRKGGEPKVDQAIVPALLPATAAGILAYLLRWQTNHCQATVPVVDEQGTIVGMVKQNQTMQGTVPTSCPQGQHWSEAQGKCVDTLI